MASKELVQPSATAKLISGDADIIEPVGFFALFRYSDKCDRLLILVGSLAAIGTGCAFPINLLVYGTLIDKFLQDQIYHSLNESNIAYGANSTIPVPEDLWETVSQLVIYFVFIGLSVLILGYLEIAFWTLAAERQTRRIRSLCYKSVLTQHIGWFDIHDTGEINTRLSDDITKIGSGIGDKFATFLQWTTTFVAGYIIGFVKGWKLTLVILSLAPLIVIAVGALQRIQQRITVMEQTAYAKAGAVAEEVLSAIRTVYAFGGEKKECARYERNLVGAEKAGCRKGLVTGTSVGILWLLLFSAFSLAFWYGNKLVREEGMTGGVVLQVFLGVLFGTMSLGHAAPNIEYIANAKGAAAAVYKLIDLKSEIDSSSDKGSKPELTGNISFEDITFAYPARPEVTVLSDFSMTVAAGSTVALVGHSGCGKSTSVQLLQRFYDPLHGMVKIDGHNILEMNVRWLRKHIGVVSQEPVLFATTIAENIRFGKDDVSQAEIEQAAKEANAFDFIMKLPEKFDTIVGERGSQLSGGQKQRIAIARALVRNPKILLLDEATSALDTESESLVQTALEKASQGRTTIVIAHRLTTVQNADKIVVIKNGRVEETGTHNELMEKQQVYYQLVVHQIAGEDSEEDDVFVDWTEKNGVNGVVRSMSVDSSHSVGARVRTISTCSVTSNSSIYKPYGRHHSVSSQASVVWTSKDQKDEEALPLPPIRRIMKYNAPEWPLIVTGCLAAIFTGAVHPSFAIIFSEIMGNFGEVDPEKSAQQARLYSAIMFGMGLVVAIAQLTQVYMFTAAGEALTKRLRSTAFSSMLRQEIGWYDDRSNQVGALTARLATDASLVRGAAGQQLGVMIQSVMNIGVAVIISLVFGWKLSLVVLAFLPLLVASGIAQGKLMQGFSKGDQAAIEEGGKIAVETIDNIRTVAALGKEDYFFHLYDDHFEDMYRKGVKRSHMYGVFFSSGQCIIFFAYAASFAYGAHLVANQEMVFKNVFRVFTAITFGGQALGRASTYAPDLGKAKLAAAKLFSLFDRKSAIDSSSDSGKTPKCCTGQVRFDGVKFHYPTRPDVRVLHGLDISVTPGQTLALVGSSGCGKSTAIQLIERFYDPLSGSVRLDNVDIRNMNLRWVRSQLGLVSQEPVLFDASIRDNIAYGDNSRDVPMDEIIAAARKANIHNFIETLPQGYDTNVGDKGTQLSGGQKQRVAIARALLRQPKVLLLDEATSALDTESEKVVQEALDKARVGRTCIVIAHRLSTIQNADIIAVIQNGVVVEQGTHQELMAKEGQYFALQQVQNRGQQKTAD